ncbi:mannitol-specific PTS transporter subunit IIC [Photobacterium sp. DNB22_13_2]
MFSPDSKMKVQGAGRFLSNMVMPNIGAFIAWGLISALFIPSGWFPNSDLATLVDPMMFYLLPILISYHGGRLVSGERGAIVGTITAMGLIAGADIPMLMGAMIAGPLGGLAIKHFDMAVNGKVKSGFEMLVNNFSAGLVGMLGAVVAFYFIGPTVSVMSAMLVAGAEAMVENGSLPLVSVLIEPAKVLFLNNAINHGVLSPLGIQQAEEVGYSIFFLLESNPGPGLGLLLAYIATGKKLERQTAAGASIIHLFGGIQEVYFPYVMMNPRLLLAVIAGGMAGASTLVVFDAGLISAASPGSIVAILLMAPKSSLLGVVLSVVVATAVSFVVAVALMKVKIGQAKDRQHPLLPEAAQSTMSLQPIGSGLQQLCPVTTENVFLGLKHANKEEAIRFAGEQLVKQGNVSEEYVGDMLKREQLLSTYLGNSIAFPHGMIAGRDNVKETGVVFCQYPEGVLWGDEKGEDGNLVIAIAAKGEAHIHVIASISCALDDEAALETLKTTIDPNDVIRILNGVQTHAN